MSGKRKEILDVREILRQLRAPLLHPPPDDGDDALPDFAVGLVGQAGRGLLQRPVAAGEEAVALERNGEFVLQRVAQVEDEGFDGGFGLFVH